MKRSRTHVMREKYTSAWKIAHRGGLARLFIRTTAHIYVVHRLNRALHTLWFQNDSCVVILCNTATSVVLSELNAMYSAHTYAPILEKRIRGERFQCSYIENESKMPRCGHIRSSITANHSKRETNANSTFHNVFYWSNWLSIEAERKHAKDVLHYTRPERIEIDQSRNSTNRNSIPRLMSNASSHICAAHPVWNSAYRGKSPDVVSNDHFLTED